MMSSQTLAFAQVGTFLVIVSLVNVTYCFLFLTVIELENLYDVQFLMYISLSRVCFW